MKVLVVQNSALGTFGAFGDAIERRYRASIKTIRPDHLSFDTVDSYDADLFVLLGSRRGVYETDVSWIAQEADFAKRLIRDGRPLLGICFGAQIIATALGGHVSPTGRRHAGWLTNDIADRPIWGGEWFCWHRDEIDLPTGVSVLARSRATIQAFRTASAIGIQFHPEVTEGMIAAFIEAGVSVSTANRRRASLGLLWRQIPHPCIRHRSGCPTSAGCLVAWVVTAMRRAEFDLFIIVTIGNISWSR
jgi:GMP synthase (glutamine-hydrolysing)